MECYHYRVTGPQSVERLNPLVQQLGAFRECHDIKEALESNLKMDFVWETYCEKVWKGLHDSAKVLNRLHNTQVLEDKGNLAFLQLRMKVPVLRTYIAPNAERAKDWCSSRWCSESMPLDSNCDDDDKNCLMSGLSHELESSLAKESFLGETHHWSVPRAETSEEALSDWWALKASKGNGGKDVWIINKHNYSDILPTVPPNQEYILQQYIPRPLLWHSKKFHFRCYTLLRGDMSAYLYEKGFILCAGLDYDLESLSCSGSPNLQQHLTNLATNKHLNGHPGQVPCHLRVECPTVFNKICALWANTTAAASPFMSEQRNANHFEFFGIDVIADGQGDCWLIEANRLPGLESSHNRCKSDEDVLYDEMMLSLLKLVLKPILEKTPNDSIFRNDVSCGLWHPVNEADPAAVNTSSNSTFKNLFNWKAFTTKNKSRLFV